SPAGPGQRRRRRRPDPYGDGGICGHAGGDGSRSLRHSQTVLHGRADQDREETAGSCDTPAGASALRGRALSMRIGRGAIALVLVLAGCAVGPNYERPATVPVHPGWRDSALALRDSSYANVPWWRVLGDTTLQTLVRTALKENRYLHIALARVNEARALL